MKKLVLSCLCATVLFAGANKDERMFWDEVKDSNDIEMLKLYKKQFPNGVFRSIADIKIKRLRDIDTPQRDENTIPLWVHNKNLDYKYYGIGFSNKHYKGIHYQENLARSRAKRELLKKFENDKLSNETMFDYIDMMKMDKYLDNRDRIYVLLYIDNYDLK